MTEETDQKSIKTSITYFTLSTLITCWFVAVSPLYDTLLQQFLSCFIAGAKWGIQIVAAFVILQNRKWYFIKEIAFSCFIGSLILIPYSISSSLGKYNEATYFLSSLVLSVGTMILLYFRGVKKSGLPSVWWAGWLFCLAIAITLQVKVVFNLNIFAN